MWGLLGRVQTDMPTRRWKKHAFELRKVGKIVNAVNVVLHKRVASSIPSLFSCEPVIRTVH